VGVTNEVDKDRSEALARGTLSSMAARGIAPTPENYELWYAYASAENPDLKRTMDALLANGCKFDASALSILHQRYFRSHDRTQEAIADVSEKIGIEIDTVMHVLEKAAHDHAAYGEALSQASGELDGDLPIATVRSLVGRMAEATRAIEERSRALEEQLQVSSHEVAELRQNLESVRRESLTDPLTGIPNRKAFDGELQKSIERAAQFGEPVCLVMCDIDHFKVFNDTWGHQTGDQVLRLVANCISENVNGGEEFAIILPQTSLADAVNLADQIRGKVESKKLVKKSTGDILGAITISLGVAMFAPGETGVQLTGRADGCLYAAKRSGRNRVVSETDQVMAEATAAA